MPKLLIAAIVIVGLIVLDRVLRAMEARGWIYYRKSRGYAASTLGPALQQLQGAVDPGAKAAVGYQMEEQVEMAESGDPKRRWSPKPEESADSRP